MPNHVTNILTVEEGDDKHLQSLLGTNDEGKTIIDFNQVIEMPDYLMQNEDLNMISEQIAKCVFNNLPRIQTAFTPEQVDEHFTGQAAQILKNLIKGGSTSWYDWSIDNWGTKWNAYSQHISEDTLEFDTAWSTPIPIFIVLSRKHPETTFKLMYADEDFGNNCGILKFKDGEVVFSRLADKKDTPPEEFKNWNHFAWTVKNGEEKPITSWGGKDYLLFDKDWNYVGDEDIEVDNTESICHWF